MQYENKPNALWKSLLWWSIVFIISILVVTQSQEGTKPVLEYLIQKRQSQSATTDPASSKEAKETYLAMSKLFKIRHEMDESGLLTVQTICDVHIVLMYGLLKDAGNLRETEVFTNYRDKTHLYPQAEQRLYTLVDRHNIFVEHSPPDKMSEEYVSHVLPDFYSSSSFCWWKWQIASEPCYLTHHSFSCGSIYHTNRTDSIDACHCEMSRISGPGDLAAMCIQEVENYNLERRGEVADSDPLLFKRASRSKFLNVSVASFLDLTRTGQRNC